MTRHLSRFGALVLAGAVAFSLGTPTVVSAQHTRTSGGNDGRSGGGDSGGRAIPRSEAGPRGGDSGGGRTSAPAPAPASAPSPAPARSSAESSSDGGGQSRAVPRAREGRPVVGTAVPRSQVPPYGGNIIIGGGYPYYPYYPYYPWYYPGYYPWGYGGIGFGFSWYSPGFYGSWYGPPYYGGGYPHYDGAVRIKVKPSRAEVLVDGYYVGIVDEFDNPFQQLQLESGPHRIEVRADGYEPVSFEVRVVSGKTTTYKAELKKIP